MIDHRTVKAPQREALQQLNHGANRFSRFRHPKETIYEYGIKVRTSPSRARLIMTILSAGSIAPDFTLQSTPDQTVSLSDFRGRNVILAFYPADWSPVCSDQLALYNELLGEFAKYNAQLLAISVDGTWSHAALARDRKYHFPLLSDFEPKGAVARRYGVYDEKDGVAERALFVIDADGIIRWSYLSPMGVNPGAAGILNALDSLASKAADKQVAP